MYIGRKSWGLNEKVKALQEKRGSPTRRHRTSHAERGILARAERLAFEGAAKVSRGYAPVPRIIRDHPDWKKKPFSKGQALVDLFLRTTHDEQRVKGVKLVRGQIFITIKGLAKEWGWDRQKVRRFLAALERAKGEAWAIEQETITPSTVDPMAKPRIIGRRITFKYYDEVCGERPK